MTCSPGRLTAANLDLLASRLEKTSLAGDAVVSDTTKAESLRKRLAEVSVHQVPVLFKSVRNFSKNFSEKIKRL